MGTRDLLASLPVGKIIVDLSSTNLDTTTWTTLSDPLPSSCSAISVAYTGKGILKLAKGAAASESELPLAISPGQNHEMLIPLNLAKGLRLSGKCDDQAVTLGSLVINLYG